MRKKKKREERGMGMEFIVGREVRQRAILSIGIDLINRLDVY